MAKASSVPTNGSDWGKNSFANTRPVTVLYKKKSYHSIAVPTVDAMTARRSWALCSSGLKAVGVKWVAVIAFSHGAFRAQLANLRWNSPEFSQFRAAARVRIGGGLNFRQQRRFQELRV